MPDTLKKGSALCLMGILKIKKIKSIDTFVMMIVF